jgi:AraC-like DNA-binding protein
MDLFQSLECYGGHNALKCPPDWRWQSRQNGWSGLVLWLIVQGQGEIAAPDRVYPLRAGDCFVLRMREAHFVTQHVNHPLVVHCLHFNICDGTGRVVEPEFAALPRYRRVANSALLSMLMDLALEAHGQRPLAEHWLRSALLLVQQADASLRERPCIPVEQAAQIDAICRCIEEQPQVWYTVDDLARRMHCTTDHFIRRFRQYRRMTPGRFIIHTRIEEAKKLLRFTNAGIAQIAALLGYDNPYFFSRQFQHLVGISPSSFRREQRDLVPHI